LDGCVFEDVAEFWAKYFEGTSWSQQSEEIYNKVKEQHDNDPVRNFPENRAEENAWGWWDKFQQKRLDLTEPLVFITEPRVGKRSQALRVTLSWI